MNKIRYYGLTIGVGILLLTSAGYAYHKFRISHDFLTYYSLSCSEDSTLCTEIEPQCATTSCESIGVHISSKELTCEPDDGQCIVTYCKNHTCTTEITYSEHGANI